jgi:ParB family chromosome partitioning protein
MEKLVVDSIIGQKLSVRDTENLIKKLKNSNDTGKDIIKENNQKNKFNYDVLQNVTTGLKEKNLDAKVDKNYFKIKINSQEDIDKIAKYFNI